MPEARLILAALAVAALIGFTAVSVGKQETLGFTLGVVSAAPVVTIGGNQEACQRPIDVPKGGEFDRVKLVIGTFRRRGPELSVTVSDLDVRPLARGAVAAGYPDVTARPSQTVQLDRAVDAQRISVCIENRGRRKVALYGGADAAARSSNAFVDGRSLPVDLDLEFERGSASLAEVAPRLLDRAGLFGFSWEGAWLYLGLALVLILGGPWLLLRALSTATSTERASRRHDQQ